MTVRANAPPLDSRPLAVTELRLLVRPLPKTRALPKFREFAQTSKLANPSELASLEDALLTSAVDTSPAGEIRLESAAARCAAFVLLLDFLAALPTGPEVPVFSA